MDCRLMWRNAQNGLWCRVAFWIQGIESLNNAYPRRRYCWGVSMTHIPSNHPLNLLLQFFFWKPFLNFVEKTKLPQSSCLSKICRLIFPLSPLLDLSPVDCFGVYLSRVHYYIVAFVLFSINIKLVQNKNNLNLISILSKKNNLLGHKQPILTNQYKTWQFLFPPLQNIQFTYFSVIYSQSSQIFWLKSLQTNY